MLCSLTIIYKVLLFDLPLPIINFIKKRGAVTALRVHFSISTSLSRICVGTFFRKVFRLSLRLVSRGTNGDSDVGDFMMVTDF